MKLALIILGLFFLSLTVRSRELTFSEKAVLINLEKTNQVKNFMEEKIIKSDLSMRDYIGFLALRRGCDPLRLKLHQIEKADEEYSEQSKMLAPLMNGCEKSTLGLSHLYIGQQNSLD